MTGNSFEGEPVNPATLLLDLVADEGGRRFGGEHGVLLLTSGIGLGQRTSTNCWIQDDTYRIYLKTLRPANGLDVHIRISQSSRARAEAKPQSL